MKFKFVDYGIQNSLDGIKRGIFSIWFYALFPTMSVALPYMAPESWEWDDYYMDKPRKEKAIVQFEIDQLTGKWLNSNRRVKEVAYETLLSWVCKGVYPGFRHILSKLGCVFPSFVVSL